MRSDHRPADHGVPVLMSNPKIQPLGDAKHNFLHVRTPEGEEFLIVNEGKVRYWLDKYHPDWTVQLLPVFLKPSGVHIAVNEDTLCSLSTQRYQKWGQNFDTAFMVVDEEPTCPTCISRSNLLTVNAVTQYCVLKAWSWANVPQTHRPGGSEYYGGRA